MKRSFNDWLEEELERGSPTDILDTLDRSRPYDGQPWTDTGERGKTEIKGITFRDLRDCFIRALYDSSPIEAKDYPKSVYDLDLNAIDIIAVAQNMSCWVEKYMGIFPNCENMSFKETMEHVPTLEIPEEVDNLFEEED